MAVPRKNLRKVAGKPLILHTIDIALKALDQTHIAVITDDDEIAELALERGVRIIREPERASGKKTLDELMLFHLADIQNLGAKDEDILLTMQPTCPLISAERIHSAINLFEEGAGSVITVKDDRHLNWTITENKPVPLYKARVNRQLLPPNFRESGAIIGCRIKDLKTHKTRIVEPINLIQLPEQESLDIDSFADLVVAEHFLTRKRILIFADAAKELGMGHVYRALALAQELARHDLTLVTSSDKPLGAEFFAGQVFEHTQVNAKQELIDLARSEKADMVILDVLDTERSLVEGLKSAGAQVVSFEDSGEGAALADLVVSDIYPSKTAIRELVGIEHAILAPSFETLPRQAAIAKEVNNILVLFGGTDPSNLAVKTLSALEAIGFDGKVRCVRGLGAQDIPEKFNLDLEILRDVKNIANLMASSDLAFSSAGRTITELASVGVPTICLAQNQKELTHTHAVIEHGVINLGLGSEIQAEELRREISDLISNFDLRVQLHHAGLNATARRSNERVVRKILDQLF